MANTLAKWYYLSTEAYTNIAEKDPNALYFIKDSKQIYRGAENFSEIAIFVDELPDGTTVPIIENKIYIKKSDYSGYIYDVTTTKFIPVIRPAVTDITAEGADLENGVTTGSAVKEYVDAKISEMIVGGDIKTDNVKLSKDITIKGQTLGSYKDGDVVPADTILSTFLSMIAAKRIPPTYNQPTIGVVSAPVAASVECGTLVKPVVTTTFTQKNAGAMSTFNLVKTVSGVNTPVVTDATTISPYTEDAAIAVAEGSQTLKYAATVAYAKGELLEDNLGNKVEGEEVKAGSVSGNTAWSGFRRAFYGFDTILTACTSSVQVRDLAGTLNSPASDSKIVINITAGTKRVTVAYPASIRDISKIIDSGTGYNVVSNFIKSNVDVEGASAYLAIGYKVFTYIPVANFPQDVTYTVTI